MSSSLFHARHRVVQFSTGIGSAEVLRRVVEQHGRRVVALSADTLVEDHDNWRFARDFAASGAAMLLELLR